MDLEKAEAIIEAMLFSTGDQEIIETVANRIIDIVDENTIIDKQMSYEDYMNLKG